MTSPEPRDTETLRLIEQVRAKHARRRRLSILGTVAVAVLLVGAIAYASVYLARHLSSGGLGSTTALVQTSASSRTQSTLPPASSSSKPTSPVASSSSVTSLPATPTTTQAPVATTPTTTRTPVTPSSSATTVPANTTVTAPSEAKVSPGAKVVVIDPGHQGKPNYETEPIGPGSSTRKAKVASGTSGVATGIPESELVLTIGLKLRDALAAKGIHVVMTRTSQDVDISNIERAQIANQAKADLFVRIHADGSDNPAMRGIHVLYPASIKGWTDDIAEQSYRAALLAQKALVAATGAVDRGVQARSDLTGFNWSDVPVILPEIGFMTNPEEDRLLASEEYQNKIVAGLREAILSFLGIE